MCIIYWCHETHLPNCKIYPQRISGQGSVTDPAGEPRPLSRFRGGRFTAGERKGKEGEEGKGTMNGRGEEGKRRERTGREGLHC